MSKFCEDYPCCGHGPPPLGDGGGCPDEYGRFKCVECGERMPADRTSALCHKCRSGILRRHLDECDCDE